MIYPEIVDRLRRAGCVWAEDEARLLLENSFDQHDLVEKVRRRAEGEPLELVVGWAEFRDLRIQVARGVFIPRRRTEFLAEQAIAAEPTVVVELCCGAGAISAAIQHESRRTIDLHAADIDPAAVELARSNLDGPVHLYVGDLFAPLPEQLHQTVDVVVANVPYVPTADIPFLPAESRLTEPGTAVDGGPDGLALFSRLVAEASPWLAPGGRLMSEVSERQVPLAASIVAGHGLRPEVREDENLGATVIIGTFTT
ncbi:putative protein N(5)-glutamine methyltransferase [Kineosporia babensis]|uniref:peptide chain release factor N(5)-glutamine methyltransferase n=1 Tax=Kineosporia babensis TaxID=499548 RepID=A0A9X1N8D1_9ACTN|nr:putative protein N(5)-glutamine methyltransferase [Kineosporia babensis]MCD5309410.1 putative protein N(5)-glutamine methyltransferase [Kineosporia babensis]